MEIVSEGSRLSCTSALDNLTSLGGTFEFFLETLQVDEVLLLDLCVLRLDFVELLLILPSLLSEARGELVSLPLEHLFVVLSISLLCNDVLIHLALEGFILDPCESYLVFKPLSVNRDFMLVVEVLIRNLRVGFFPRSESLLQLRDGLLEVTFLQRELLHPNRLVFLVGSHSIFKEVLLSLGYIRKFLGLHTKLIDIFVGKYNCLDHASFGRT